MTATRSWKRCFDGSEVTQLDFTSILSPPALVSTVSVVCTNTRPWDQQMEQIKRANKLFTNDCIFLKKTLSIPVISEKPLLFNGLNSIESPENETVDSSFSQEEEPVLAEEKLSPPSPQESDIKPVKLEEVSARDFLQRLDLQIKLSTQAAKKLKEESRDEESPYATSLYHS
ncbi:lysM and putative peptidoglycan-binding domain-containing protein 2 isoform X1 [Tupaia chinensis]|uniref:lysM and putative peptidoglycan-binding domain-containing protein 2 isoform X1 n=2 Tax=Tupaia chinensis TaxID=246437 RepID=UPI0003C8E22D|nr:lysM and putative peptidoglycan-binding domain-containing protein 2 isoform X1 [Tupaia chinensis]